MGSHQLDDVDRGILHLLQEDARNNSAADIAEEVGVAPNTVRNRIERLEDAGVIEGYHPHINYEQAGYQLHVTFICTVPIAERQSFAADALEIDGVIRVVEALSGKDNLAVEAVGETTNDLTEVSTRLESIGCDITGERFTRSTRVQPFDHFGVEVVE
ncbi:Lrp/AsnC family transcriptional regulator [Halopiger goleimassiliensis]|uniref:Lrp/AsnC family transcriptional regulator n=1 Tax=Halopiger goleimassiliensis TaxID=1293048 RepID=UPI000677D639|nr:Lrp/AsnC family transcriptional regulator [Halopiger goleimassiliensis]